LRCPSLAFHVTETGEVHSARWWMNQMWFTGVCLAMNLFLQIQYLFLEERAD
jgi:hypothetical protein